MEALKTARGLGDGAGRESGAMCGALGNASGRVQSVNGGRMASPGLFRSPKQDVERLRCGAVERVVASSAADATDHRVVRTLPVGGP